MLLHVYNKYQVGAIQRKRCMSAGRAMTMSCAKPGKHVPAWKTRAVQRRMHAQGVRAPNLRAAKNCPKMNLPEKRAATTNQRHPGRRPRRQKKRSEEEKQEKKRNKEGGQSGKGGKGDLGSLRSQGGRQVTTFCWGGGSSLPPSGQPPKKLCEAHSLCK